MEIRIGKALAVLWRQFRSWEHTLPTAQGRLRGWHLASKCWALIKHDRILRGKH